MPHKPPSFSSSIPLPSTTTCPPSDSQVFISSPDPSPETQTRMSHRLLNFLAVPQALKQYVQKVHRLSLNSLSSCVVQPGEWFCHLLIYLVQAKSLRVILSSTAYLTCHQVPLVFPPNAPQPPFFHPNCHHLRPGCHALSTVSLWQPLHCSPHLLTPSFSPPEWSFRNTRILPLLEIHQWLLAALRRESEIPNRPTESCKIWPLPTCPAPISSFLPSFLSLSWILDVAWELLVAACRI